MVKSSCISLDLIVAHVVSLYRLMDSKPKGIPTLSSFSSGSGKVLTIDVVCNPFAPDARRFVYFQGFHDASNVKAELSIQAHFEWFTRLTQRWTCSSLCCIFVRYVIPAMLKQKISEMLLPDGTVVELKDLHVHAIFFRAPPQERRHTFQFKTSYTSRIEDTIETVEQPANPDAPASKQFCTHNVLVCHKSGAVIDFCGGQFTGDTDQPHWFPSFDAMVASGTLPGDVLIFEASPQSEIDEQIERDESSARAYLKMTGCNDKRPAKFAKRAVENATRGWDGVCRQCFGTCENLFACSRCKEVKYCGKLCQKRAWRKHKHVCAERRPSKQSNDAAM
jgi:hypothetical protein